MLVGKEESQRICNDSFPSIGARVGKHVQHASSQETHGANAQEELPMHGWLLGTVVERDKLQS